MPCEERRSKKQIPGHDVYNDKNEKAGKVYDIIIAPENAFLAAGGFYALTGMRRQSLHFKMQGRGFILRSSMNLLSASTQTVWQQSEAKHGKTENA